jgi:hypothetical protein
VGGLEDVLWGSFLAGFTVWPTLDLLWRFLAFPQRGGVGHFRTVDRSGGR